MFFNSYFISQIHVQKVLQNISSGNNTLTEPIIQDEQVLYFSRAHDANCLCKKSKKTIANEKVKQ